MLGRVEAECLKCRQPEQGAKTTVSDSPMGIGRLSYRR
jgi:hypothetical protein